MNAHPSYGAWKNWSADTFGVCRSSDSAYFAAELARIGLRDLRGMTVLELGFGNGAFARWCVEQRANYVGTEAIPELVDRGRAASFAVHAAARLDALVSENSVDLIVAWDVLEHIDAPHIQDLLSQARRGLRSRGLILARVPSGDSPFAGAIQNGDITHRSVLGSGAIRQMAREALLDVVLVGEPCFIYPGLGVRALIRRLAIEIFRRPVYKWLVLTFMGGGAPVMTPNMVFALQKNDST